ncbi:serine/threonine-protein kinase [Streptomyces sp. VRA16 Mangrove soil]|uniref:serine/threonine-protein kinase n=1 Tax=Streptomyces sp. VRA16 Mangrove soil TaxID=2817434 RepID=UPI001A9CFAE0|nr:serine/threonine-protein kinase [Streptomyces sp. VRA16 Mangrove soil]MBO1335102.1 serine/threonine protein kinase [Streptomyces sp. VRA16 Mangrove soil]
MQGQLLAGRYRLGESIGRGGMGRVWRAHDEVLHRVVAVKELTAAQWVAEADRAVLLARTQTEARAAARINHPAVVTVHDVLEHDDRPWIVMELVEGPSLADAVKEHGRIVPAEAARIGLWTLRALRAAHAAGVLHRDIKPGNVLLAHDGRVKLTDFGIAQVEGDTTITRTGEIVGSVDYLAPERVSGAEPGPASDLWALGATLYTAVEGRSPFRRTSPISTMQAVIQEEPEPPEYAGELGPVIAALLRKDPATRPRADEAETMLAEVAEGRRPRAAQAFVPTQVHTASPTTVHSAPPPATASTTATVRGGARRWPKVLAAVVGALLIGGGGAFGSMYYMDHRDSGSPTRQDTAGDTGGGKGGSASPSSPGPSASKPGATGTGIPANWVSVTDPEGFSLMLPPGWQRRTSGAQIDYTPDGGRRFLRIAVDRNSQWADSHQHQLDLEKAVQKQLPDYRRVSLQANTYRDRPGSRWEFTWTAGDKDTTAGPRRAVEETYVADDGTEYALYMSAPADQWPGAQRQFTTILKGWRP